MYTKFPSFKRHLFQYHKPELGQSEVNISIPSLSQSDIDGDVLQLDVEEDDETVSASHYTNRLDPELEKRLVAIFLLKTQEVRISQSSLVRLVYDITELID